MRVAHCTLFGLLFASSEAFPGWGYNLSPGVTPVSHAIFQLHMVIFWICIVIGILVFGAMFYAIINHRKSKGVKPARFHEHLWVELAWTIIPLLILVVMAIPATKVLMNIRDTQEADLTIKITGFQWKWKYEYLTDQVSFFSNTTTPYNQIHGLAPKSQDYLLTVDHPLVIPIHKKVRFLFTSNDVIHSWWVPAFGTKQDAVPGFIIESWTRVNRPGVYHGQCAELCGINHAYMPIVVIAMTEKDFAAWMQEKKYGVKAPLPTAKPSTTVEKSSTTTVVTQTSVKLTLAEQMQAGEKIYLSTCAVCHQASGEGLPPTFPALKNGKLATGPVAQHINRVVFGKAGTAMQAFKDQLSDEDIAAVVTYERNAFGNNKGDIIQSNDIKAAKEKGPLPE